jgi:hypothetical protein
METLKKLLPLPAIALLVLAACTNPLTQEPTAQAPTPAPTPGQEAVTDEAQPAEQPPIPADIPETTQVPESRFGTNLKCSDLEVTEHRQDCDQQVNDLIGNMLESEIINTFDLKRCKDLPDDIALTCEVQLADTGVQGPISNKELATYREAVRGTLPDPDELGEALPVPEYDISKCSRLTTSGYKAYCEAQVNARIEQNKLDEIIQSGDSNRCSELAGEDNITQCKLFFGIEVPVVPAPLPLEPLPPELVL